MNQALIDYLTFVNPNNLWEIRSSPLGGRGVFAKRDIAAGTELVRESGLVIGPRADPRRVVCVGCHQPGQLRPCSKMCGLLVCCTACESSPFHQECSFMTGLSEINASSRYQLVTPLRAIFLSPAQREILNGLEGHDCTNHDDLLSHLRNFLTDSELAIVQKCHQVLDATAYETPTGKGGSARAIFPVGALTNHNCTPNTRHQIDSQQQMMFISSRHIDKDEEITTSYTCTTWGSLIRKSHLLRTKRFSCACQRCKDPTEFGSRLMGLYCLKRRCEGVMLPSIADDSSDWACQDCQTIIPRSKITQFQKMILSTLNDSTQPSRLLLKKVMVPNCNQYAVEVKLTLVHILGHSYGLYWQDLTDDELRLKQVLCHQLSLLLKVLKLGSCHLQDILNKEESAAMAEYDRRNGTKT